MCSDDNSSFTFHTIFYVCVHCHIFNVSCTVGNSEDHVLTVYEACIARLKVALTLAVPTQHPLAGGHIFYHTRFKERQQKMRDKININKNSSGDEIANVNFYAVRPEATRIR